MKSMATVISKSSSTFSNAESFCSQNTFQVSKKQAIVNGVKCSYKRFEQKRNITFQKANLTALKQVETFYF